MKTFVIDEINFRCRVESLGAELMTDRSRNDSLIGNLVEQANIIARPRAAFLVCPVQERGKDYVVIAERRIHSRVLSVNFNQAQHVFPFIATCGNEIEDWSNRHVDELHRFWARRICELALKASLEALASHIEEHFHTGPTSEVNPGSTIDWPIKGQWELFQLLGDAGERIGVSLTKDLWMAPAISTSGIRYPSQEPFENCSLCALENCRLRKAPYEEGLYERRYQTV